MNLSFTKNALPKKQGKRFGKIVDVIEVYNRYSSCFFLKIP
jgi:hypothetical protein